MTRRDMRLLLMEANNEDGATETLFWDDGGSSLGEKHAENPARIYKPCRKAPTEPLISA